MKSQMKREREREREHKRLYEGQFGHCQLCQDKDLSVVLQLHVVNKAKK